MLHILQMLQLADSSLPVGSAAHSSGFETMVVDGDIGTDVQDCARSLAWFLDDLLCESLLLDAVFCREAHTRALREAAVDDLNRQLSALRMARESREASLTMGSRFARLAAALDSRPALSNLASARELHYSVAFGYTLGLLAVDPDLAVEAFLHQNVLNTISAAQRLLPLGQMHASRIAWDLKPAILKTVIQSRSESISTISSFTHLPELASMRHPVLPTRLFIS